VDSPEVPSPRSNRSKLIVGSAVIVVTMVGLIGWAMTRAGSTAFYMTPTELAAAGPTETSRDYRVNGTLVQESVERDGLTTTFDITDGSTTLAVTTDSPLPDAFYSKQTVEIVAQGDFDGEAFVASDVFAKCPSKFKAEA
jgi:cytochrome c-type biogenesis protein CcmE